MKRSRLIIPLVALATMALMLSATGASAKPHTTVGEPTTTCDVDGAVALTPGIDINPSSSHYRFEQTQLQCNGKKGDRYNVQAEGDTTDEWHGNSLGGETCAQGGSITEFQEEDDAFDVHSGWIEAEGLGEKTEEPKDMIGEVHFVRAGDVVLADGPLWDGFNNNADLPEAKQNPPDQWFQAELIFEVKDGDCTKENPVTAANLMGTAQIYNAADVVAHDCGGDELKGKDDKDNHCF